MEKYNIRRNGKKKSGNDYRDQIFEQLNTKNKHNKQTIRKNVKHSTQSKKKVEKWNAKKYCHKPIWEQKKDSFKKVFVFDKPK